MKSLLLIAIGSALVNNVVLSQFLGLCPFLGVSKKVETAAGMGAAVLFVITIASAVTNLIYTFLLVPTDLTYLNTIVFILVIAALVQFVEMVLKKSMPALYESLGVFLPLITTNCAVLGTALTNVQNDYSFIASVVNGIGISLGFLIAIVILAGIREKMEYNNIPVNTLNLIQYMHDKYYYEAAELALMDTELERTFATGIAGFSHAVDSLSAIKYAKVKAIRDEDGLVVDYEIEGDFPKYGNDDDRADDIAVWLLRTFLAKIKKHHTYRNSEPTTSILTITSNVVYGKATGTMPDGRKAGEPLAPGANPSYGAEQNGLLASLNSVAKLPYEWALDGISNTQTINPDALGHEEGERINNLVNVMDGYFDQGAHHLNVNVFGKEKLIDAMEHPEKEEYANFTIRVSGYAVKFIDLTREQQMDVISRTCHATM